MEQIEEKLIDVSTKYLNGEIDFSFHLSYSYTAQKKHLEIR